MYRGILKLSGSLIYVFLQRHEVETFHRLRSLSTAGCFPSSEQTMTPNWSHSVYIALQNFPGMVLAAFVLYVVMILMLRKVFDCCSCHRLDECSKKLFFMIPEIIFGPPKGVINFEPSRTSETHIIYVGSNKVRKKVYISLWILATTFMFSTIIVFWDLFLHTLLVCW